MTVAKTSEIQAQYFPNKAAFVIRERGFVIQYYPWHLAIFPGSYPPSIFATAAFNNRVRDGIGVVPPRHKHQENW